MRDWEWSKGLRFRDDTRLDSWQFKDIQVSLGLNPLNWELLCTSRAGFYFLMQVGPLKVLILWS